MADLVTRDISRPPAGLSMVKFLILQHLSRGNPHEAAALARKHCDSLPQLARVFEKQIDQYTRPGRAPDITVKAGVAAASTSSYSTGLSQYGIAADAWAALQSRSILARLLPLCRRIPFRVQTPHEIATAAVAEWRGEGLPSVATKTSTDTTTHDAFVSSCLVVVSDALLRFGAATEGLLRRVLVNAVAKHLDNAALDPSVTAVAGVNPDALTVGAVTVSSTGSSAAQILADLASMIAGMESQGDVWRWIMQTRTFFTIAAKLATLGMRVSVDDLLGIPCILSSTSPQQITLLDCEGVAVSYDGEVDVALSSQSAIEMQDSLTQDGTTGTGASLVSMYQTSAVAIRAALAVNYSNIFPQSAGSPAVPNNVVVMAVSY